MARAQTIWVAKEQPKEVYEAELARVRAAEDAIEHNRCPNGCGTLSRKHCRTCGFHVQAIPALPVSRRPEYFRQWHRRYSSPSAVRQDIW